MFDILYQNSDFLVINKHPNISVHKDDGETSLLIELAKVTGDKQLYLIHRLDKMTSGLLLIGCNQSAASELSQLDFAYAPPFSTVWDPLLVATLQIKV